MEARTIRVEDLRRMLDRGERVTVLDVRTAEDHAEGAIPGSLHVDAYRELKAGDPHALDGAEIPGDAPVVTVCGLGRTASIATEQLRERGLEALTLEGGMKAWSMAWNTAEVPIQGSEAHIIQVRRTAKGCLSYVIGSGGSAVVIDASLDPEVYEGLVKERGWRITDVLDTHVHADHLSRSRVLAQRTGATLRMPETDRIAYPYERVRDGDVLRIGHARLAALRTPGHTGESTSYLLDGRALFTGDTLFLAGVGRPDLEASPDEARGRARLLYGSLRELAKLPPDTLVLPGHTSEPVPFDRRPLVATLAEVRGRVPLLHLSDGEFVETILGRIPPTPPNHDTIVEMYEAGQLSEGDPTELEAGANRCAVS